MFPRMRRVCGAASVIVWMLLAWACGQARETRRGPIIRDSAGVRIVDNFDDPVASWRLTPTSLLEIGSVTDTLTSLFQVAGAHRLGDGRIVIANRGTDELRYYRADGTFLKAVGGSGQGPGEFERIAWTARCGTDTLYVYDSRTRRLTVLDDQGQTVRLGRLMLPDNTSPSGRSRCQPGGPFVSAGWDQTPLEPGLHRNSTPVGLASLAGEPLVIIGDFPGVERWGDDQVRWLGRLPFGRTLLHTIVNDRVFVGTADTYEVAGYRLDGTLAILIRLAVDERPVTDKDVEAYIERELRLFDNTERRQRFRRMYLDMELPTSMPSYAAFIADDAGALWIQDFPGPRDEDVAWRRFSPDGSYIGLAIMPAGLEVFEIGDEYVLGVWRDELDVEYVQLFGLEVLDGAGG